MTPEEAENECTQKPEFSTFELSEKGVGHLFTVRQKWIEYNSGVCG